MSTVIKTLILHKNNKLSLCKYVDKYAIQEKS